jgi:hypothetical protein
MTLRPELIAGLRQLLADGATLSGLVKYVLEQHPKEGMTQGVIRAYLMEAFSVPFHERLRKDVSSADSHDFYARLNLFYLPEIVAGSPAWYAAGVPNGEGQSWLDHYRADDDGRSKPPEPGKPPAGISEASWAVLSAAERERVQQMDVNERDLGNRVRMLAHLAERLQRKVSELQKERPSGAK